MTDEALSVLIETLAVVPATLGALVNDLSEEQLRTKQSSDEFSVIENICHLRDIEIEGYGVRISRILKESVPALPDIDGGQLAVERDYNQQPVSLALEEFRRARLTNVELLSGLDEEQLNRAGMLEDVGTISLQQLLEMMREHDESHFAEIRAIREKHLTSKQNERSTK